MTGLSPQPPASPLSAPAPPVFSLVYVSAARRLARPHELCELVRTCRANNARAGITGALLYAEGTFMQALEGEESRVRSLFRTIMQDPRHVDPIVMVEETNRQRQFGEWHMAYGGLGADQLNGFSDWHALTSAPPYQPRSRTGSVLRHFGAMHQAAPSLRAARYRAA